MVFLQNVGIGYCGIAPFWWKKGGGGYTMNIDEAQQFTIADARAIVRSSKGTHFWKIYNVKKVLNATCRIVDVEKLQKKR